jgi:hypothetical protein
MVGPTNDALGGPIAEIDTTAVLTRHDWPIDNPDVEIGASPRAPMVTLHHRADADLGTATTVFAFERLSTRRSFRAQRHCRSDVGNQVAIRGHAFGPAPTSGKLSTQHTMGVSLRR